MVQTEHVLGSYETDFVAYINSIPRPARLLLVDPFGTGRAYSVAAAIRALVDESKDVFRCLIVAPESRVLLQNWSDLLRGFGFDVILANPPFAGRQQFSDGGVTVASAQIILANRDVLWNIDWDMVVVDDPQSWLAEEWLQQGAMQFWEGASNVSVAIALSPVIPEKDWLEAHPKTRIVRRQHATLWDDLPQQTFGKPPVTEQDKLRPAIQVIRDYFDISGETSKFAETRNVSSFIADIISSSPQQWIDKETTEPRYSQIVRFLLAVGQVFAATYPEPPIGNGENSIRLPSEEFLAEHFGVHRVTARRAFEELRNLGLLRRNQGGSHLTIGNITSGEPAVSPEDAGVSFDETAIEEVRALYEAGRVPSSGAQSAVEEFRAILDRYELGAKSEYFQEAIRSSFVSGDRQGFELPDQDAQVLRQLGVGWPGLSEYGLRIGRELTNALIESKADTIEEMLAFVPPRVVALFHQEAQPAYRGSNALYSLRIPDEEGHASVIPLPLNSSLAGLLKCSSIRPLAVGLGNQLVEQNLATTRMAPGYRGAKWAATFFDFPEVVADSIKRWLDKRGTTLQQVERLLKQLELLRKSPIPSLQEFDSNGIGWEVLGTLLDTAMSRGIISKVVDQGPAFLILDQDSYQQIVLRPVFNEVVAEMREADQRGEKLGLSQDELAFYDALAENQSAVDVLGEAQLAVIATELVVTVRRNTSIDWTVNKSVKARLRVLVRRALRKYGYPPDLQEAAVQTVLMQAELLPLSTVSL